MNWDTLALIACVLAAIPAGLFVVNLFFYRPIPRSSRRDEAQTSPPKFKNEPPHVGCYGMSVLIPARNEELNLTATLQAVLANHDVELEVIVLDDHSTDRTAEIVRQFAMRDPRVRLESAPALPAGWCGKQHACHILAQKARHPLLVFIDADVQLAPDALSRMAGFLWRQASLPAVEPGFQPGGIGVVDSRRAVSVEFPPGGRMPPSTAGRDARRYEGIALASGVPHQVLGTFSERLLLPQIHFVLLGYLPLPMMRWTKRPSFSAGCGQLFIVCRDAYEATGGHAQIRATLHDGVKLPRLFRRQGFRTDLFDATDLASCRMYRTDGEVWRGLGKNATEGLAAPAAIGPMSLLLFGGQVMPFLLLPALGQMSSTGVGVTIGAVFCAWLPRLIAVRRFQQPLGSALLHPLGVLALLAIQWLALARQCGGKPAVWKGRSYGAAPKTA